jgi:hypothetical protein
MFFTASGVLHGGAIAALIVAAMWRVDKLELDRPPPQITVIPPPPPGNSGGGRAKPLPKPTEIKPRKQPAPKTPVQPFKPTPEDTTTTVEETGDPGTGGGGDGHGHDTPEIGSGCIEGVDCGVAEVKAVEPPKPCSDPSRAHDADCQPPPQQPPQIVVVEKLRVSGETQIQPSDDIKVMMQREGKSSLHVTFKVCLDAAGAVTQTARLGSTGYGEYDDQLAAAIATWRYRPYSVNGHAIAVCGPVTFNFHLR